MYQILLCIIFFLILGREAYGLSSPIYRPSVAELEAAVKPCLPGGSKVPINDKYTCPVGNFSAGDSQTLSSERITCSIQIALSLEAIDKKTETWAKSLQSSREKDVNRWFADININTRTGEDSFANQYSEVCSFTGWTITPDGKGAGCAKTTGFFPEVACRGIVDRRVAALQSMGYIYASKGIAKSFQNEKDINIDKVKGAYVLISDKWSLYKRIVSIAVSKFNAYIREAVK